MRNRFILTLTVVTCVGLCRTAHSAIDIAYVPVGNPVNPGDPASNGKRGGVANAYVIGKYKVTNAQYAEFLNTVDPADANTRALYNPNMSTDALGGITIVGGNADGGKYVVKAGHENKPVVYVSWFDAARMANWLGNGQGAGSTETGAHPLTSNTTVSGKRSANAKVL